MARQTLAFVLAVLCVLAGCSGFDGEESTASAETVTPAPVPEVPADPAEGISEHQVDAPVVATNHHRALANTSYTSRTQVQWQVSNNTTYADTTVHRVDAGGQPSHVVAEYGRPRSTDNQTGHELWSDGNRTLLRVETEDGDANYRRLGSTAVVEYPRSRMINSLFARLDPAAVRRTSDGETIVTGRMDDVAHLRGLARFRNERNATMAARVTPSGYVDRVAITFEATYGDAVVDVRLTYDVTDVGSTTVTEPDWVENVTG
jgi:hypothetical protein